MATIMQTVVVICNALSHDGEMHAQHLCKVPDIERD